MIFTRVTIAIAILITVLGPQAVSSQDAQAPAFGSDIHFIPNTLPIYGETLTCSVTLTDGESGVKTARVFLTHVSGTVNISIDLIVDGVPAPFAGSVNFGTFRKNFTITGILAQSETVLNISAYLEDNAGNSFYGTSAQFAASGMRSAITVYAPTNPLVQDTEAPTLNANNYISVEPNQVTDGDNISCNAIVLDNRSGVNTARMYIFSEDGEVNITCTLTENGTPAPIYGDNREGTYKEWFIVNGKKGADETELFFSVYLRDNDGNARTITSEELQQMGVSNSIRVVHENSASLNNRPAYALIAALFWACLYLF